MKKKTVLKKFVLIYMLVAVRCFFDVYICSQMKRVIDERLEAGAVVLYRVECSFNLFQKPSEFA